MIARFADTIEPRIIRNYAVASTFLFFIMTFIASLDNTLGELVSGVFVAEVESVSIFLFISVLISSIAGMLFHHIVSLQTATRNSFAFVFSFTSLKFLGALVVFNIVPI